MSLFEQNANMFAEANRSNLYTDYQDGLTGRYTSEGVIDPIPDNDLSSGYIWVRIGNNRSAEACLNVTVARAVGIPVVTAYNKRSKQREVIGVNAPVAVQTYGGNGAAIMNTPTAGTAATIIKAMQFEPGLALPDTTRGGLYVLIRPFWAKSAYIQEYSLPLVPTATSDKVSFVCVYYDTVTGTFGQALTDDQDMALITDIAEVIAANPRRLWLAAFGLENGATTIDTTKIVDLRFFNTPAETTSIQVVISGGGSAISTGIKTDYEVPFSGTITAARLFADQTGSIVIDIWNDTYANFPPTDADSITASAPPTLSSAVKSEDTTLTGWTKTVDAGDILRFNVDSAATVTRVTLSLTITRT